MKKVQSGDYVKLNYTGKFEDGEVFDTSHGKQPLEIQVGTGSVIPGFDKALHGMAKDESKNFTVSPEEAYGEYNENLEKSFQRSDLPDGLDPQVGDALAVKTPSGEQMPVWVSETNETEIKVDMNHPLAGKSLHFEVQIMEINDSPSQGQGCGCSC